MGIICQRGSSRTRDRVRAPASLKADGLLESTTHANQQSRIYMTHNSADHTSTLCPVLKPALSVLRVLGSWSSSLS